MSNPSKVRTRIAPSPTGFLHLGTARTALYSWAYARHHDGEFVLRIEDTDVARSTQDSVDQILQSMHWLGLNYEEGPIYQMQRLDRYAAVIERMLAEGTAYRCYTTPEELDALRERQKAKGEKTGYDGRWRPAPGKTLPPVPEGVKPVIRFANPLDVRGAQERCRDERQMRGQRDRPQSEVEDANRREGKEDVCCADHGFAQPVERTLPTTFRQPCGISAP